MSAYVRSLRRHGFLISDLRQPLPSKGDVKAKNRAVVVLAAPEV